MRSGDFLFTSESVTVGHPDKMADQISDAVLDAILEQDPKARVACESLVKTGVVILAGEVTTSAIVHYADVAREAVKNIGFTDSCMGFDYKTCGVMVMLDRQSPDISRGVTATKGHEQGAGDQGIMFGYACNQTPELMPAPIQFAHRLTARLAQVRRTKKVPYLYSDGKSQVTVEYDNAKVKRLEAVVISCHHAAKVPQSKIRKDVIEHVIKPALPKKLIDGKTRIYVNPTGRFEIGGPMGDCGVTGRKIIVDTYGGWAKHGGGAFSGKDPSKVDRSANYFARYVAKNVVAAGLAASCEIELGYAIGVARPVGVYIDTWDTGVIPDDEIAAIVEAHFDFRPAAMIKKLDLLHPIYQKTAQNGHFGNKDFPWEKIDMAAKLRKAAGLKK